MKKSTKLSAFTLIELLIVIAIIGILAGLMFPAIQNVMGGAQATQVANNGRSIVQAIMQANTEREANGQGNIWARVDGTSFHTYTGNDSNKYFWWLISKELIKDIGLTELAGGGVAAAADLEALKNGSDGQGNVWDVLACNAGNLAVTTPFLWSRNFDQVTETEIQNFKPENSSADDPNWKDKLDVNIDPFNDKLVVIVRRGGAMEQLKKNILSDTAFMKGVAVSNTVKIMKANRGGNSGGGEG